MPYILSWSAWVRALSNCCCTLTCHSLLTDLPLCALIPLTGFQAWVRSKQRLQDGHNLTNEHFLFLCLLAPLARPSVRPQYDNRADDLTKDGMLKGIESSAAFVLFLSTGVLERPYCQMEIRHALALKKPVVLLHGESEQEMRAPALCAPVPFV